MSATASRLINLVSRAEGRWRGRNTSLEIVSHTTRYELISRTWHYRLYVSANIFENIASRSREEITGKGALRTKCWTRYVFRNADIRIRDPSSIESASEACDPIIDHAPTWQDGLHMYVWDTICNTDDLRSGLFTNRRADLSVRSWVTYRHV